jgi:hypothetical protein
MKKHNLIFKCSTILICLLALFASACEKNEKQGPKGEQGPPGTGGNANTNASPTFVVAAGQWQSNTKFYFYNYSTTFVTNDAIEKGMLKVFTEVDGLWWELPFVEGDKVTQCGFSIGSIKFTFSDVHGGIPGEAPETRNYRIVSITESARTSPLVGNSTGAKKQ